MCINGTDGAMSCDIPCVNPEWTYKQNITMHLLGENTFQCEDDKYYIEGVTITTLLIVNHGKVFISKVNSFTSNCTNGQWSPQVPTCKGSIWW